MRDTDAPSTFSMVSAAVWMVSSGIPIEKVSEFLGHTNIMTTRRVYARFAPEHLRDAAEVLEIGGLTVVK